MWKWVSNTLSDKDRLMHDTLRCPFMDCPSNFPFMEAHKPRMKFIQKLYIRVYQYRCEYCHNLINVGTDGPAVPVAMRAENINPSFLSRWYKPNYTWRW